MLTQTSSVEYEPIQTDLSPDSAGVRILLACDDLHARTAVSSVLLRSGYSVETAASSFEAMESIESGEYSLVLCDFRNEAPEAGPAVLQLARSQEYRPATALLQATHTGNVESERDMVLEPVDVPYLLTAVAELLAGRAFDRSRRAVGR